VSGCRGFAQCGQFLDEGLLRMLTSKLFVAKNLKDYAQNREKLTPTCPRKSALATPMSARIP